MRTKYLSTVALICASAYALALGIASYRLGSTVSERKVVAAREFDELVDRASSAAVLGFMDEPFRETVRDAVRSSRALAAAIVTGPRGPEYAVEREAGYLIRTEGEPRFAAKPGTSRVPLFAPLRSGGTRNATVSAGVLLVDAVELFMILRDTLVAISFITLLASGLLVIDILRLRPEESASERKEKSVRPVGKEIEEPAFDIDIPDLSEDVKAEISEEYASSVAASAPEDSVDVQIEAAAAPASTVDAADIRPGVSPSGLYSPRGDIGWEAYAADRLASELHRCASFEQDLVLLMMEPKKDGAEWEKAFSEFAESAVSFFTFRDLVFERGDRGISVILPNVNLEHGLRMADEFRNKLRKGPTAAITGADIRVGLTSRSGRLVDAERLMLEASRALSKAIEAESSPVVAFKSDPDRYRSFIAARA